MESEDAPTGRCLDHAEVLGEPFVHGQGSNRNVGAFVLVIRNHVANIHTIDVIRTEYGDDVG